MSELSVVLVFAPCPRALSWASFQRQAFFRGSDSPELCGRFPVSSAGIHAFALWGLARWLVRTPLVRMQVRTESEVSKVSSRGPWKPVAQARTGRGSHPGSHCEPDPGCRLPGADSERSAHTRASRWAWLRTILRARGEGVI